MPTHRAAICLRTRGLLTSANTMSWYSSKFRAAMCPIPALLTRPEATRWAKPYGRARCQNLCHFPQSKLGRSKPIFQSNMSADKSYISRERDDWDSAPEHVPSSGVRVEERCVEKEVSEALDEKLSLPRTGDILGFRGFGVWGLRFEGPRLGLQESPQMETGRGQRPAPLQLHAFQRTFAISPHRPR